MGGAQASGATGRFRRAYRASVRRSFALSAAIATLASGGAAGADLAGARGGTSGGKGDPPEGLVATACGPRDSFVVDCAGGPRSSPFACVRFDEACRVHVRLPDDETWYELLGVNGVAVEGVVETARSHCDAGNWKKRLAEDLPALMEGVCRPFVAIAAAGSPGPAPAATATAQPTDRADPLVSAPTPSDAEPSPGVPAVTGEEPQAQPPLVASVDLVLREPSKGAVVRRRGVRSTPENRELVKACWTKEDRCPIQRDEAAPVARDAETAP